MNCFVYSLPIAQDELDKRVIDTSEELAYGTRHVSVLKRKADTLNINRAII